MLIRLFLELLRGLGRHDSSDVDQQHTITRSIQMTYRKDPIRTVVRNVLLLLLLALALVLTACNTNQSDSLTDRSFMTSQPCAAPCWYGLEADKASREDVYATLQKLPFVDQTSIKESITTWQNDEHVVEVWWSCLHPQNDSCGGGVRLSGNKLKSLYLMPGYTLTFSDTVQKLGPPNYVSYFPGLDPRCGLSLIWLAHGISINGQLPKLCPSLDERKAGLPINPNIQVLSMSFESPDILQSRIAQSRDGYQPWPGFSESALSFLDFVPGSLDMWLFVLLTLVVLVLLALKKRDWPSPVIGFALAAAAMIGPTMQFQFSDIITPTCGAYFVNVLLCGTVYTLIAEAARRLWQRRTNTTTSVNDKSST